MFISSLDIIMFENHCTVSRNNLNKLCYDKILSVEAHVMLVERSVQ